MKFDFCFELHVIEYMNQSVSNFGGEKEMKLPVTLLLVMTMRKRSNHSTEALSRKVKPGDVMCPL